MRLYHGTRYLFPFAFELKPQKDEFAFQPEIKELEDFIELHRPFNKLSRKKSVFLADDIDLIDPAGGYTDAVYLVEVDEVEKSDLGWYTLAQAMLEEGKTEEAEQAALNYWDGTPYTEASERCPEYRCTKANIVTIVELNVGLDELEAPPK